ncbi:helix-turn-helix domain-containing protein [Billgrantia endophytica]|uniref:Transcriptional regulator n=1 Tax=Billgrantia endophytica TaxID=2033802 RepID=A0A2N7U204_9GAMM|nr:helix-turn-helix domain-containing protein [Halomonas endophytica]PMR74461.1 transcriptional regulator [Halomonas endophytica]
MPQSNTVTVHDAQTLGQLIRRTRKQQGLNLATLAGLCGLSIRFLSELENGRDSCGFGRIMMVLDTLGIDLVACPPEETVP